MSDYVDKNIIIAIMPTEEDKEKLKKLGFILTKYDAYIHPKENQEFDFSNISSDIFIGGYNYRKHKLDKPNNANIKHKKIKILKCDEKLEYELIWKEEINAIYY